MRELIFLSPYLFALLLVLPVLTILYFNYWTKREGHLLVSQIPDLKTVNVRHINPKAILFLFRMFCLANILIALTEPTIVKTSEIVTEKQDVSIVLALDVSGSMLIEDLKPSRIEALKAVITNFITQRKYDKIGLVLYAGESITYAPLTTDKKYLLNKIANMDNQEMEDGTAIGLGLASAINVVKASKSKNKVVILLTDGENNAGFLSPLTASAIAKKSNIKVHTIALGKKGKVPMPILELDGSKSYIYLDSKMDEELLKKIALQTKGKYFNASSNKALEEIYKEIDQLEKTEKFIEYKKEVFSLYPFFIIAGLAILVVEILLGLTLLKSFTA